MTPLQISILLHYYSSAVDFRDGDFSAPAVRDAIDTFRANPDESQSLLAGMLDPIKAAGGQAYGLTERGRVYIEHLLAQPLPVSVWVIPGAAPGAKASNEGLHHE